MTNGAGLVEVYLDPLERELLEQHQRQAMRQDLDKHEFRTLHIGQHPLGDLLVIHRVGYRITHGRAHAVARKLQIENHGLWDLAFPVDESDDALALQAAQVDAILSGHGGGTPLPVDIALAVTRAAAAARPMASAHALRYRPFRALRPSGASGPRLQSSPRCRCRTPVWGNRPCR